MWLLPRRISEAFTAPVVGSYEESSARTESSALNLSAKNVTFSPHMDEAGESPVAVKNTFLHFPVCRDADDDDQPPMLPRCKTLSGPGRLQEPERCPDEPNAQSSPVSIKDTRASLEQVTLASDADPEQSHLTKESVSSPPDMPMLVQTYHKEPACDGDEPDLVRSLSDPPGLEHPGRHEDSDEQPTLERRCTSDLGTKSEPLKVPLPKNTKPPAVDASQTREDRGAREVGSSYRDLSPYSRWLGLGKDDEIANMYANGLAPGLPQPGGLASSVPPMGFGYAGMPVAAVPAPWMGGYLPHPAAFAPPPAFSPFGPSPYVAGFAGWPTSPQNVAAPGYPYAAPTDSSERSRSQGSRAAGHGSREREQSPLAAWLGVPAPKEREPGNVSDEIKADEDAPPPFVRIPSGAELPSVGAAEHNAGKCKPCAHSGRPGGCSKGKDCTFCHACDGEAFKRSKKEKVAGLKAAGVPKKRPEKKKKQDPALVSNFDLAGDAAARQSVLETGPEVLTNPHTEVSQFCRQVGATALPTAHTVH